MEQKTPEAKQSPQAEKSTPDFSNQRLFAVLGYLVPILFFLPLLNDTLKENAFSRFHANQQLILLLLYVALGVLVNSMLLSMFWLYHVAQLLNVAILALAVYGAYGAYKEEQKELPLIGHFRIL
jgi:uncharacterized membrane protein